MPSRRRKKPPDFSSFSRQSISCLPHHPPFVLLLPPVYFLHRTFKLGRCFGLVCGSRRTLAWLHLGFSSLVCSSLGRRSTPLNSPWVVRTHGLVLLLPSPTFVAALIAPSGSVGVALDSPNVAILAADSALCRSETQIPPCLWVHLSFQPSIVTFYPSFGKISTLVCFAEADILVDLRSRYVSSIRRLLVVRYELQVCYIFLFPPPIRANCSYNAVFKASTLMPTLFLFGVRFRVVSFTYCWESPVLGYYLDSSCWILCQICDVLPTLISKVSLVNCAAWLLLRLLLGCFNAYGIQYEDYLPDYVDMSIGDSVCMAPLLFWFLPVLWIWFCGYVVKPFVYGFQLLEWAHHTYLGLILDVCSSNPFVKVMSLWIYCDLFTDQHELCRVIPRHLILLGSRWGGDLYYPFGSTCLVLWSSMLDDPSWLCFLDWVCLVYLSSHLCSIHPTYQVGCAVRVFDSQQLTITPRLWGNVSCRELLGFWAGRLLHMIDSMFYRTRLSMSLLRLVTARAAARVSLHHLVFLGLILRGCVYWLEMVYCLTKLILSLLLLFPLGVLLTFYLMNFNVFFSNAGFDLWLLGVIPSLLLSLALVVTYARNSELLALYFCWYLTVQASRDEVKGIYPLAYDDLLTEAMLLEFLVLIRIFVVLYPVCWWFLWSQLRWYETQLTRATAIPHGPSYSMRVFGSTSNDGVPDSIFRSYSLSQCTSGLMLYRSACISSLFEQDVIVSWFYQCIIVRRHICNSYCWNVAHQYCVPGPCLRALDWQHRLPGYAFDGLGDCWYLILYSTNCYVLMGLLFLRNVAFYLVMSTNAAQSEFSLILSFLLSKTCCEKLCQFLWTNSCDSLSFLGK